MSSSKCSEYYRLYGDLEGLIIGVISQREAVSFDELREELERRGIYMDGRCLRKAVASMVRAGKISKKPDQRSRKMLLTTGQAPPF